MQIDRYLDISKGVTMVVTDLHGDGEAFDRCVETFLALRQSDEVDHLVFLGDLVHGYGSPEEDASLRMVLRIIEMQEKLGEQTVIALLGNHEMPHIYGISLAKGSLEFTPRFEHALGSHRNTVIEFFKRMPFAVRTGAGVLLSHAGPDDSSSNRAGRLRHFDHNDLLDDADRNLASRSDLDMNKVYEAYTEISGHSYAELALHYLAVEDASDPRYPHLMRALFISERDHRFEVLWDFLFSQNERGHSPNVYEQVCQRYLDALGVNAPVTQRVCVSGHIAVPEGGYQIVNSRHFRLASAAHAQPRNAGCYLLLDNSSSIQQAEDLIPFVYKVF